jgi:hypothetical protein
VPFKQAGLYSEKAKPRMSKSFDQLCEKCPKAAKGLRSPMDTPETATSICQQGLMARAASPRASWLLSQAPQPLD